MSPADREIYDHNLKHYKAICDKIDNKKSEVTTQDRNNINAYYYIVISMYNKYGCPNCTARKCDCGVLPNPHDFVRESIRNLKSEDERKRI